METSKKSYGKQIAYFAIFVALTIVLQVFGGSIKIGPVTMNFTLLPLVLCGMMLGVWYATGLGAIVGLIILIQGITGIDGFTNILFGEQPVIIIIVCILKTSLAGAVSALTYKAISKKNKLVATFVAAALVPIINTGIFIIGMFIITKTLVAVGFIASGSEAFHFLVIVCAGVNFLLELAVNMVFAPALFKLITVLEKYVTSKVSAKTVLEDEEAEDEEEKVDYVICPYCSAKNSKEEQKCTNCGALLIDKKSNDKGE